MSSENDRGVRPVMLTPFCSDGAIDWAGLDAVRGTEMGWSWQGKVFTSDDGGATWSAPARLTDGQIWHQAPCNVHHANGCVYLVMDRRTRFDIRGWYVGEMAPVLMRRRLGDDLTQRENWTFASELTFRDVMTETLPDHFGVPFFAADPIHGVMVAPTRHCNPMGWLETNVVQVSDPDHLWCDRSGRTFHLWMRAHTGSTGYACIAKVVEQGDQPGSGEMTTMLEKVPSGKTRLYAPCPGGQMKFHALYDEWCFAGLVTTGPVEKASRHYASMAIDGDDLVVLSRSGDERAKSPHDGNLITFHRVKDFRGLAY